MKLNFEKVYKEISYLFKNEDQFQMKKIVTEFIEDEKFKGDYYNFLIWEHRDLFPKFYHILSPFDVISNQSPQHAMIFQNGKLLLNQDYTEYASARTGIMDAIFLKEMEIENLDKKRILIIGSGKIAKWSLYYLKEAFPELIEIDFTNKSKNSKEFVDYSSDIKVKSNFVDSPNYSDYDILIFHTNSDKTLLTKEFIDKMKPGSIITTYISSTAHGEIASEFYDSKVSNIVLDWHDNLDGEKELSNQIASKKVEKLNVLKDLFANGKDGFDENKITIFRSKGTPMQNLAVLRTLLETL